MPSRTVSLFIPVEDLRTLKSGRDSVDLFRLGLIWSPLEVPYLVIQARMMLRTCTTKSTVKVNLFP